MFEWVVEPTASDRDSIIDIASVAFDKSELGSLSNLRNAVDI